MFKKSLSILLVLYMILSMGVVANAEEQTSPITVDVSATVMSVTVPTSLPIGVNADGFSTGEVTTHIINNSAAQVEVTNVKVEAASDWTLKSWDTDWSKAALGTKEFAFKINGTEVATDGSVSTEFGVIDGNGAQVDFTYEGKIAPQGGAEAVTLGNVVFTIGWVETEETIPEVPKKDEDNNGNTDVDYTNLAPGLYKSGSNYQTMLMDWDTLMANNTFTITSGTINHSCADGDLAGDLVISKDAGITTIGASFLEKHNDLTGVVIPYGVTKIDSYAFMNSENLSQMILPSTLKYIQAGVGSNCVKLTEIEIPTSVIYFGNFALDKVTDVYYAGTEQQWNSIEWASTGMMAPLSSLETVHYQ